MSADRLANGPASDPLWYQDAVIYQTHVKAFFDTNGDGSGDFRGLTLKLDYIRDLGVDCIWLLPFYPSPMRDDGYDIADYRNVHPAYGSRRDFRRFVSAAHRRGIRVITELIVNHTSDQHPWFQAARRAPRGSAKRNYYVWSDDDSRFAETRIIFTDTEASNWTWDPVAGQYYWHRFFSHQPDLNHNNPQVVRAVIRVMRFWLDMGVDGLRLDAIPYLCVRDGTNNENLPETHAVIKQMRAVVDEHYQNRVFLAEANQWPEDVRDYFGDGDECHMAYHFPLMPRMYMALAQEERHPIVEIMEQTPEIPPGCQWAIFLRNHDELTLEMVSDRERDYMYQTYAADPRMRVNVGIRRRLAPLLGNDPGKIRLMVSLLLSMPGSPILYYGDELGMGDNIYLGDRNAVRTPMQWSPDRNAGFSRADPEQLYLPPVMDPIYGYPSVNVEAQSRAPSSLLNWTRRIIEVRKQHHVFGRGCIEFLHPGNRKILAYVRRYPDPAADAEAGAKPAAAEAVGPASDAVAGLDGAPAEQPREVILCVGNLGRGAQPVELDLAAYAGRVPIELLGQTPFPPIGELPYLLTLPGHGFYWFRLATDVPAPAWHDERVATPRLQTLVLPEGWRSLLPEHAERRRTALRAVALLQNHVLPAYLSARCGGAAAGSAASPRVLIEAAVPWHDWLLTLVRVDVAAAGTERLFLPLAIRWQHNGTALSTVPPAAITLAQTRRQATPGLLFEALADAGFVRTLACAIGDGEDVAFGEGRLALVPTAACPELLAGCAEAEVHPLAEDPDNAAVLGDRLMLKTLHCRVPPARPEGQSGGQSGSQPGASSDSAIPRGPEPMVDTARHLTEVAHFPGTPALAGHIDHHRDGAAPCTLALLEQYVPNQGDLDGRVRDLLQRLCDEHFAAGGDEAWRQDPGQIDLMGLFDQLGARVADLHTALAAAADGDAFRPESMADADHRRLLTDLHAAADGALSALRSGRDQLPAAVTDTADRLLTAGAELHQRLDDLSRHGFGPRRCRLHGDLRLARVLVAQHEPVFIGAGGPAQRPCAERRAKRPPLLDLGTLVCDLHTTVADIQQRTRTEHPDLHPRLAEPLATWRREAVERLLAAHAAAAEGSPLLAADPEQRVETVRALALGGALERLATALAAPRRAPTVPVAAAVDTVLSLLDEAGASVVAAR
ncbi:maltose alpha-D-glucosyltransferase [uncultured Thiohalocapsa sp.]|uniref:maltose alpha-D-glucosyltransferase n=1 Tax=uncultured Thiohalocapsa sp. TaxID=768990 RepID=UPI0025EF2731|nr:maltose alpha-D-glucosyltransferase [uncultured Thiohalocapsa sp.]